MIDIPDPPRAGEPIKAALLKRILDLLRSLRITAGPGIYARTTPAGTSIGLTAAFGSPDEPDEPDAFLAVLSSSSAGVHSAKRAGAGRNSKTFHLVAPEVHTRGTVPSGATVIAHRIACRVERAVVRLPQQQEEG